MKRDKLGFVFFALASAGALAKLLSQDIPGHYRVFTGAARALWAHGQAYGTDFGTGVGDWFYSPGCALYFYGPFTLLPEKLGLALYMLLSWAVFVAGVRALVAALSRATGARFEWGPGLFWAAIAPQLWGAVLASKLEILLTGMVCGAAALLVSPPAGDAAKKKSSIWAGVLLGLATSWKFQPFPTVGLLAVSLLWLERDWIFPAVFAATVGVAYKLPLLVLSSAELSANHDAWQRTFSDFVESSWLNFENVFAFSQRVLGLQYGWGAAKAFALVAGAAFLAMTLTFVRTNRLLPSPELRARVCLLACALGAAFTAAFSPLGQNNAYVLYAPLLLAGVLSCERAGGRRRSFLSVALLLLCLGMILPYSDFVPSSVRETLRPLSLKPVFCLVFAISLWASGIGDRRSWGSQGERRAASGHTGS